MNLFLTILDKTETIWRLSSTPPKSYAVSNFFSQPTFSLKIMENGKFWQNENRREQCDFKKMIQNVQFFSKKCLFWQNHEHLFSNRWVKRKFIFIFLFALKTSLLERTRWVGYPTYPVFISTPSEFEDILAGSWPGPDFWIH